MEEGVEDIIQLYPPAGVVLLQFLKHVREDVRISLVQQAVRLQEHGVEVTLGCLQQLFERI